ncbi:reverse transcriptase [Cucumis melo var. makuwa]|uniref:Reverse transcriptase n=1 Tax=Cucumis melo var. makuwa TaxID=1194695 RepID=A0A5A7TDJ9_CUCMM|nr:reverse transcriptase [Cucumis melo var. makuwa]TYK01734.1 reverse transcriptase [Cucumis melo var. makuwa]
MKEVKIVVASMALHNFIRVHSKTDFEFKPYDDDMMLLPLIDETNYEDINEELRGEQGNVDTEVIVDGNGSNDENEGTRSCTKHSIANYLSYENLSPQFRAFTASLDSTVIPKNIHIALDCPEWKNAVMEEMRAFEKNKTWEICDLPRMS